MSTAPADPYEPPADRRPSGPADQAEGVATLPILAERVGFEPTELSLGGFQDRCHQPLGHLSAGQHSKGGRADPVGKRMTWKQGQEGGLMTAMPR